MSGESERTARMALDIHGIQPPVAPEGIGPVGAARNGAAAEAASPGDVVEISAAARLAAQIDSIPDVRAELVERVRAEIAAGTYETPDRIERTITKLMDELLGDS